MNKKIKILSLIFMGIIIGLGIGYLIYLNTKGNNDSIKVSGLVTYTGKDYVILETKEEQEYFIKTKNGYLVGTGLLVEFSEIYEESYPKEGNIIKIEIISTDEVNQDNVDNNIESNENTVEESNNSNGISSDNSNSVSENNSGNNDVVIDNKNQVGTEEDVVSYFTELNNKIESYSGDKSLGDYIKSGFVTIVDFLFYGEKIKGKTFSELSNDAKIKVLQLAFSIDSKIEEYFPGYKESISSTGKNIYTNIKTELVESYLDITTRICEEDTTLCDKTKKGFGEIKETFSLTWDFIKDISGVGLSKLKSWYEIWRES